MHLNIPEQTMSVDGSETPEMPPPIPPMPAGWNLTLLDLMNEVETGKRRTLQEPETSWALEYERSQLPAGIRFPHKGDVYEARADTALDFHVAWGRGPSTCEGRGVLLRGERVRVAMEPRDARPLLVHADVVDSGEAERRIVPAEDRDDPQYSGFFFSIRTVELHRNFVLVSTAEAET